MLGTTTRFWGEPTSTKGDYVKHMFLRTKALRRVSSVSTVLLLIATVVTVLGVFQAKQQAHAQSASNLQFQTTTITEHPLPSGNSDPWGVAEDSNGHVWVAVPGCDPAPTCPGSTPPGHLAEFNPANNTWIQVYQLPSGYAQPFFLTFDKQGKLWFALPMGNSIGMFNPTNASFQQWTVPTASSGPWDVAVDHNGKIWFTEHFTNKIGSFDPTNHTFKEIHTPASNSQPYGITVDAANNIWFTENNPQVALIAKYTTTGKLLEYKIRNTIDNNLTPHLITIDHQGNVWWSEGFVGMVGMLKPANAAPGTNKGVTEYAYPSGNNGNHTSGIGVDSNGHIWFDDSLECVLGHFNPSTKAWKLYNIPPSNSHPHDGLMVDTSNRKWFTAEFADNLGEAV